MNRRQSHRILAIGNDVSRLSSGANILTQAGYSTDLLLKIDDLPLRLLKTRYHLAIVSSAFPYDQQIAIRAGIRQVRPKMPVLLLAPEHAAPDALLDAVANSLRTHLQPHLVPAINSTPTRPGPAD